MINRVVLIGRMTRDPELRRTQNGSAVTSFTLAINRPKRNDEEQQADYISCVVWNKTAEIVEKYVHKGDKLYIEGKLRTRNYDDSKGVKRYITEVFVDSIEMLTPKVQQQAVPVPPPLPTQQPTQRQQQQVQQPAYQQQPYQQVPPPDDLPF